MPVEAVRVRTVAADPDRDLLSGLPPGDVAVWVRRGDGLVGWGEAARFEVGDGVTRYERAQEALTAWFAACAVEDDVRVAGTGPVAFGSFAFDPDAAGSVLVVPRVMLGRRDGRAWVTTVGDTEATDGFPLPTPPERTRYAGSSMPDRYWLEAVAAAIERIEAGKLDKAVLARDVAVWSKRPFDQRTLLSRLAARFPDCFTFACRGLVGATPELLVRRSGRHVESLVLAGTTARSDDPAGDAELGRRLLASEKDRREHEPAVASVRDALADVCTELDVDAEPFLLRLANVQHLATRVAGTLGRDRSALQLAGRLHPTAAVCGAPTATALALIRELEDMDRGRYAGPVGWVDAGGDGEWGIALRCAELSGARARLFAGNGIVAGSLPEAELEETRLKLAAMQAAFDG